MTAKQNSQISQYRGEERDLRDENGFGITNGIAAYGEWSYRGEVVGTASKFELQGLNLGGAVNHAAEVTAIEVEVEFTTTDRFGNVTHTYRPGDLIQLTLSSACGRSSVSSTGRRGFLGAKLNEEEVTCTRCAKRRG